MKVKVVSSQVKKLVKFSSIIEPEAYKRTENIIACLSEICPITNGLLEVLFILASICLSKKWLTTAEEAARKLMPMSPKKKTVTGGLKFEPMSIPLAHDTNNRAWTPGLVSSR